MKYFKLRKYIRFSNNELKFDTISIIYFNLNLTPTYINSLLDRTVNRYVWRVEYFK